KRFLSLTTQNYNFQKASGQARIFDTVLPNFREFISNLNPDDVDVESSVIPSYALSLGTGSFDIARSTRWVYDQERGNNRIVDESFTVFSGGAQVGTGPWTAQSPSFFDGIQMFYTRGWDRFTVELGGFGFPERRHREYDYLRTRANRYGLAGFIPLYENAYFRTDHFGHMRDMLEQRPYTTTFNENSTIENDRVGKIQGPVFVRFIDSDGNYTTTPISSSNTNQECTSSIPFFDGEARN
ncbi:MAG: hypothetical protein ACW98X_22590, partial [Promethearchaeota archaeon]